MSTEGVLAGVRREDVMRNRGGRIRESSLGWLP